MINYKITREKRINDKDNSTKQNLFIQDQQGFEF